MRTVPEWIGRNDDARPPVSCQLRIIERQGNRCALTGREFRDGDNIDFDHRTPLWLGGENREGNLQAVLREAHQRKTKAEASVRAKVNARKAKALGLKSKKSKPFPGGKGSRFKRCMDGTVIDRRTGEVL